MYLLILSQQQQQEKTGKAETSFLNRQISKFIWLELKARPVNCGEHCLFLIRWFSFRYYSLSAWLQHENLSTLLLSDPPCLVLWLSQHKPWPDQHDKLVQGMYINQESDEVWSATSIAVPAETPSVD